MALFSRNEKTDPSSIVGRSTSTILPQGSTHCHWRKRSSLGEKEREIVILHLTGEDPPTRKRRSVSSPRPEKRFLFVKERRRLSVKK